MSQQDTITERIRFLREAGEVMRCHAHGSPDLTYNVARHSYNVLNLILLLHPAPALDLVKAAMWHDAPERITGDIPAATKWGSKTLTALLKGMEERVLEHYQLETSLLDSEQLWLECCDKLELYLWATEQASRGDNRFHQMRTVLLLWFREREVPLQINRVLEQYNGTLRCLDTLPGQLAPAAVKKADPTKHFFIPDNHNGGTMCIECDKGLSSHPLGQAPF